MFAPPAGPGVPATGADEAWRSATASCRQTKSYQARLRVSGQAGPQRIPTLTVDTGLTADGSIYMSATASGRSIFLLAGTAKAATLWLRREERSVVAEPGAIIEAILGVPLPPDRLLSLFAGCITRSFDVTAATQYASVVAVQTPDAKVYLEPDAAGWRVRAGQVEGFSIELERAPAVMPEKVWIRTVEGRTPRTRLDVRISDAEANGNIPSSVFTPPAGAARADKMTLEELRASFAWKEGGPSPQ